MKKLLKALLIVVLLLVVVVAGYVVYVFVDYHRIEDNQALGADNNRSDVMEAGTEYGIVTWNVGFGAYSRDFSFFMDGGTFSRAYSKFEVNQNIGGASSFLTELRPDLILLQEVDLDSTRSYHVNEEAFFCSALNGYGSVSAVNYDSPYLFYPLTSPHGKSVSEILTLSSFRVNFAVRRSLPVESGLRKFLDLDRCYSVTEIPVSDGKLLRLYNFHLSAYTSDGTIATEQLRLLLADMRQTALEGNYAIAGGDFNKDLLGDSSKVFGVTNEAVTWSQPFPVELLPEELTLVAVCDAENPVPSCRNCDIGYEPGVSFVLTIDGFIVSDNVTVTSERIIDTDFTYSDHNPVEIRFILG